VTDYKSLKKVQVSYLKEVKPLESGGYQVSVYNPDGLDISCVTIENDMELLTIISELMNPLLKQCERLEKELKFVKGLNLKKKVTPEKED
jgi:hypothetical protein